MAQHKSRYAGVYYKHVIKRCKSGEYHYDFWCARFQRKGHKTFIRHFPFTPEGEEEAGKAIAAYLQKNKIQLQYMKGGTLLRG